MASNALALGVIDAFNAGQQQRDRTERRNALSRFANAATPEEQQNALRPLAALGDFQTLEATRTYREGNAFDQARQQAAPMVREGRYGDAARTAAAGGQVDLAQQLMQLDRESLVAAKARGERAAATVYAALQLPPERRAAYIGRHQGLASELGVTPEMLQAFDFSNDAELRAMADQWMDTSKLAGDVSLQRFGDSVQTVRTGVDGTTVLDSRTVPQTRAETFEREQFAHRRDQDRQDNAYRQSRAEAEDAYRAWQMDNSLSRSDIEGRVLQKAINDGYGALSAEEKQVYDRAVSTSQSVGFGGFGGYGAQPGAPAQSAPATARAAAPATARQVPAAGGDGRTAGSAATVQTEDDFNRLPVGAWFVNPADGRVMQKER